VSGRAYGTGCRPAQLRLTLGPTVSEATQQDTAVLVLTNASAAGCDLRGYPRVALSGRGGTLLPFSYRRGGDQMLTGAAPALVPLRPGGGAYFAINKVTCAGHESDVARRIQVIPPGGHRALSHAVRRFPTLGYCEAGDPGHTIDLTPIEPSLRDLAQPALTKRAGRPLVTWRLRANPLVGQAWHVSCPLGAGQGPPCRCAQVRYYVHEVGDIPQPDGVVGAAGGQGLAVWAERH
jgi:hypothetical protein